MPHTARQCDPRRFLESTSGVQPRHRFRGTAARLATLAWDSRRVCGFCSSYARDSVIYEVIRCPRIGLRAGLAPIPLPPAWRAGVSGAGVTGNDS
jgi:hypothetical protein